jgi:MscS family membrane protein
MPAAAWSLPLGLDGSESILDRLWATLRQTPPSGWVTLVLAVAVGVVAGGVVATLLRTWGDKSASRGWAGRRIVLAGTAGPASLSLFTLGLSIGLSGVVMTPGVRVFIGRALALLWIVAAAWFAYNVVALTDVTLRRLGRLRESQLDAGIAPLIRKTLRIVVVILFVLFTAENVLGANIGTWLAGLGIAGLAVSLAAQDSIRNLFGSLMIFLDRPFTVGEQIQFDRWEGPVEEIGFRSTRLRTTTGEVVTIPNSKLADTPVVNVDRRSHIRRVITLTLAKDTPPDKIERALAALREILSDPDVTAQFDLERHPPRVTFDDFAGNTPTHKVHYWIKPPDQWAYLAHAEKLNLRIARALSAAEIKLA